MGAEAEVLMVLAHCPRHEGSFTEELKFKEISGTKPYEGQPTAA